MQTVALVVVVVDRDVGVSSCQLQSKLLPIFTAEQSSDGANKDMPTTYQPTTAAATIRRLRRRRRLRQGPRSAFVNGHGKGHRNQRG